MLLRMRNYIPVGNGQMLKLCIPMSVRWLPRALRRSKERLRTIYATAKDGYDAYCLLEEEPKND